MKSFETWQKISHKIYTQTQTQTQTQTKLTQDTQDKIEHNTYTQIDTTTHNIAHPEHQFFLHAMKKHFSHRFLFLAIWTFLNFFSMKTSQAPWF